MLTPPREPDEGEKENGVDEGIRTLDLSDANRTLSQEGLEPPTYCLEGSCSIQMSYWRMLERVTGIEPAYPAWKAGVLPLNYTRKP